ncbi:hypothetical protein [Paraburkholderia caribensis]|uniref:hypothetical protein n=1 Tax=Paraburkholderia caribensis TaxID=75105 RepID=UPI0034D23D2D
MTSRPPCARSWDGRSMAQERRIPLGSVARPMTEDEILDKARANLSDSVRASEEWIASMSGDGLGNWRDSMELAGA